jgi:hypothetical protein
MVGQQLNYHVEVSWNGGTSKSSIKKNRFSLINNQFFGYLHLWKPPCSFSWIFLLYLVWAPKRYRFESSPPAGCLSDPGRVPLDWWTGCVFSEGGVRVGMTCRTWRFFSNKSKWVMAVTVENHLMGIWQGYFRIEHILNMRNIPLKRL